MITADRKRKNKWENKRIIFAPTKSLQNGISLLTNSYSKKEIGIYWGQALTQWGLTNQIQKMRWTNLSHSLQNQTGIQNTSTCK